MCIFGLFFFKPEPCVCFIPPVSCRSSCSKLDLFYPITLTARSRTLDTEQLEVISSCSERSYSFLCTTSVTLITSYFVLQLFKNVFFISAKMEIPWEQNYVLCIFIYHAIITKTTTFRTVFSI